MGTITIKWVTDGLFGHNRRRVQRKRSVSCYVGGTPHEWQLLNESILYYDRTVATEVCLYCDMVQATVKERTIE